MRAFAPVTRNECFRKILERKFAEKKSYRCVLICKKMQGRINNNQKKQRKQLWQKF